MVITYRWTTGGDPVFQRLYTVTEAYYSQLVGGEENRRAFIPYNASAQIPDVALAFCGGQAVGCAGLKPYSDTDAEVKRVWVDPAYRGQGIASALMDRIEDRARKAGFRRVVLQTRPIMPDAIALYTRRGYALIPNYPPYDRLKGAVCYAKALLPFS
ncbi:MAG: GNAT family N-acetyltransferase [Clostridia bacterium]|nr:GNAT family N-acetyltransferase [Clostridia bacterium]